MKQKVKGRRILSFLLTLVLIFSLGMTAFAEDEKEGEQKLQTTVVTEENETGDTTDTTFADEADRQSVIEDSIEAVQRLIDALPDTVNTDNAESVKAQLAAIDDAKAVLSDEELDKLNMDKYVTVLKALGLVEEAQTLADTVVAKIGNKEYTTLADAVAEAGTNGVGTEIVLVGNATGCAQINIRNKNITINLNNYNIEFTKYFYILGGTLNLEGTGKVYEKTPNLSPVIMKGSSNKKIENYSVINVGSGVTLEGWAGLMIDQANLGANYGMVANVKGTLIGKRDTANAPGSGLYVNGSIKNVGTVPKITLDGATVQAIDGGNGMYLAGYTETKIINSKVQSTTEGGTGIEIRAGKLTISNSEITGGSGAYTGGPNGSGSTSHNVALAVMQHATKLPIEVTVESGTLSGGAALIQANPQNNEAEAIDKVDVQIKGGTFAGQVYSENKENFVSGGSFSSAVPEEYCAENFYPNSYVDKTTGKTVYSVHEHKYEWIIDKNPTATEKGIKHEECSVCGDKKAAVEIPAAGANSSDKNNQAAGNKAAAPETGDNNSLILWVSLFAAAIVVMCGSVIYRRERF